MAGLPFVLTLGTVWIVPGMRLTRGLGISPGRADPLLDLALAYLFGIAASVLPAWLGCLVGLPPTVLGWVLLAGAGLSLVRFSGPTPPDTLSVSQVSRRGQWVGLTLVGVLVLLGAVLGGTFHFYSDAPDHVGTIREILASGRYFPTEAFHAGIGSLGADARKGLLHPVLAALCAVTGVDPLDAWLRLPALTAPLPFLASYGFLRLAGLRPSHALAGGVLTLVSWAGGLGREQIGISNYPNQIGVCLFWLTTGLSLAAASTGKRGAIGAALAAFGAVAVHPMILVFLAIFYGILGLHLLLHGDPRARRSLGIQVALGGLLLAPYLLYRFLDYAPANPIHTELQGMLLFGSRWFIADPLRLLSNTGLGALVAYPALVILFARRPKKDGFTFYAFWISILLANLTLNPFLVPAVQKKVTYLVFRSFWMFPPALAVGMSLPVLLEPPLRGRTLRPAVLALLAFAFLPGAVALTRLGHGSRDGSALRWRAAFETIAESLPPRAVVAGDPITSYNLPAFTDLKVVCTFDQHSPPNDARGPERILAARDILSPVVDDATAWALARREHAEYVLIQESFGQPFPSIYWVFSKPAARLRAAQLDRSPYFRRMNAPAGFALFAVRDSLPDPPPPPLEVLRELPLAAIPPGPPILERDGVALFGARVSPEVGAPGTRFTVVLRWGRAGPVIPPEGRTVAVRFDALDQPGRGRALDKIRRKLRQIRNGVVYRFRNDGIPGGGLAPPDLWPDQLTVVDTLVVRAPRNAAPGSYEVSVALLQLPEMPNHRPRDYLSDRDLYAGTVVDTVRVTAR